MKTLSDDQRKSIEHLLEDGDDESAIETVFEWFPQLTRDQAVDIVLDVERGRGKPDQVGGR